MGVCSDIWVFQCPNSTVKSIKSDTETCAMSAYDLDDMAKAILEAIYHHGGQADTSEIKEYTGFSDNSKLSYRRDKHLEPKGFVETEVVDKGDTLTITEWTLTEKGEKAVDREMTKQDTPPLANRVDELREIVSDLNRDMSTFKGQVDHVEETNVDASEIEEIEEKVESEIEEVAERLNRIEAKQDALLGVLWLYDMVNADRIIQMGEDHSSDFSPCEDGIKNQPFKNGAVGTTAGPKLKAWDELPTAFTASSDELEEQVRGSDESRNR